MYSEKILKTFINSQNVGELKGATVSSTVKSKKYGDVIKLSLKINDNLIVEEAKFKAFGGVVTSVCASVVCDLVHGKNLFLVQKLTSEDVLSEVGKLPEEKEPIAALAIIALLEAIKKYLKKIKRNQQ